MVYFFINLGLHLLISCVLLFVLLHYVSNNQNQKNKRGIAYLLPVFITALFLLQTVFFSAPRILDSVNVVKSSYLTVTGQVESVGFLNHSLVIDGKTYYYNPFVYKPKVGNELEISYTPNARYIAELALLEW